jgi:hypothetical protein
MSAITTFTAVNPATNESLQGTYTNASREEVYIDSYDEEVKSKYIDL